mmetsp:Transcript_36998/g.54429  ORF Transcript_36998/g.54429 Transcript_36998/m.54429 type:complete len:81 (-) Transcript_36998:737-979(-)
MFQLHNGNVVSCKDAIASIATRIKSLNAELESNEKKYAEAKEAAELAEGEEEEEGEEQEASLTTTSSIQGSEDATPRLMQ